MRQIFLLQPGNQALEQLVEFSNLAEPKENKRNSKFKVTFFDVRGIVNREFLPQGLTINRQMHKEIL